jgi:hypothetical protein
MRQAFCIGFEILDPDGNAVESISTKQENQYPTHIANEPEYELR